MTPPQYFPRDRTLHLPGFTPDNKTSVASSPRLPLLSIHGTLSEIPGPAFGHEAVGPLGNDLLRNFAKDGVPIGERPVINDDDLSEGGVHLRQAVALRLQLQPPLLNQLVRSAELPSQVRYPLALKKPADDLLLEPDWPAVEPTRPARDLATPVGT